MEYNIVLNSFEGPLDLLLHLIDEAKLDIYDIPINEITEQYIDYINRMEELDLEITSDFIIMVSTLINIKSKMLLPKEENEEDPREKLVLQLIEYRKFKEVSKEIEEMSKESYKKFTKRAEDLSHLNEEELCLKNLNLEILKKSFIKILKDKEVLHGPEIEIRTRSYYPLERAIDNLKDIITSSNGEIYFQEVFRDLYDKDRLIAMFLAVLELTKLNYIEIKQIDNYENILLKRVVDKNGQERD